MSYAERRGIEPKSDRAISSFAEKNDRQENQNRSLIADNIFVLRISRNRGEIVDRA